MKKIILLIFLFSNILCLSQNFNYQKNIEPNPFLELYNEDKPRLIKKEILLETNKSTTNQIKDTLSINYYDKKGNVISKILFDQLDQKGKTLIHCTFKDNLMIKRKVEIFLKNKTIFEEYKYNNQKNLIEYIEYTLRGTDTTSIRSKRRKYDENNNLIEANLYAGNTMAKLLNVSSQKAIMNYDKQNRLVKHTHINSYSTHTPISKYYYTKNNLDSVIRFYEDPEKQSSYIKFRYDKFNNLVFKEEPNSSNTIINYYTYEYENNKLIRAKHFKDTKLASIVDCSYHNGKLTRLEAKREKMNYYGPLYYFSFSSNLNVTIEYIRNKKGIIIQERKYFDGVLQNTQFKEYEYY